MGGEKVDEKQSSTLKHSLEVGKIRVQWSIDHRFVIADSALVETLVGQSADTWVHTVLDLEHGTSEAAIE